jgi:hypothetical protein
MAVLLDETQRIPLKGFLALCHPGKSLQLGNQAILPGILPNLQMLKTIVRFEACCHFATSSNGWITKDFWIRIQISIQY